MRVTKHSGGLPESTASLESFTLKPSSRNTSGPRSSLLAFGVLLLLAGAALVAFFPLVALVAAVAAVGCAAAAWFKSDDLVWKAVSAGLLAGAVVLGYFGVVAALSQPDEPIGRVEFEQVPVEEPAP